MNPNLKQLSHLQGDGSVGKSMFVSRLRNISFNTTEYKPTVGVEVFSVDFETIAHGPIRVNFWDTAGQEKFGGLRDGYYLLGMSFQEILNLKCLSIELSINDHSFTT